MVATTLNKIGRVIALIDLRATDCEARPLKKRVLRATYRPFAFYGRKRSDKWRAFAGEGCGPRGSKNRI